MTESDVREFLRTAKSESLKQIGEVTFPVFRRIGILEKVLTVLFFPVLVLAALFLIGIVLFGFVADAFVTVDFPAGVWKVIGILFAAHLFAALLGLIVERVSKTAAKKSLVKIRQLEQFCPDNGQFLQQQFVGAVAYGKYFFYAVTDSREGERIFDLKDTSVAVEMYQAKKTDWMIDYPDAVRLGYAQNTVNRIAKGELPDGAFIRFECKNCKKAVYRKNTQEYTGRYLCPHCGKMISRTEQEKN